MAGRVAALESALAYLAAIYAIEEGEPKETSVLFYKNVLEIAMKRYCKAQPGPEKEVAASAMTAVHTMFGRIQDLLNGE